MEKNRCSSCKKEVTSVKGTTIFNCPNCGKGRIIRCKQCREVGVKYRCQLCEFTGPN